MATTGSMTFVLRGDVSGWDAATKSAIRSTGQLDGTVKAFSRTAAQVFQATRTPLEQMVTGFTNAHKNIKALFTSGKIDVDTYGRALSSLAVHFDHIRGQARAAGVEVKGWAQAMHQAAMINQQLGRQMGSVGGPFNASRALLQTGYENTPAAIRERMNGGSSALALAAAAQQQRFNTRYTKLAGAGAGIAAGASGGDVPTAAIIGLTNSLGQLGAGAGMAAAAVGGIITMLSALAYKAGEWGAKWWTGGPPRMDTRRQFLAEQRNKIGLTMAGSAEQEVQRSAEAFDRFMVGGQRAELMTFHRGAVAGLRPGSAAYNGIVRSPHYQRGYRAIEFRHDLERQEAAFGAEEESRLARQQHFDALDERQRMAFFSGGMIGSGKSAERIGLEYERMLAGAAGDGATLSVVQRDLEVLERIEEHTRQMAEADQRLNDEFARGNQFAGQMDQAKALLDLTRSPAAALAEKLHEIDNLVAVGAMREEDRARAYAGVIPGMPGVSAQLAPALKKGTVEALDAVNKAAQERASAEANSPAKIMERQLETAKEILKAQEQGVSTLKAIEKALPQVAHF